MSLQGCAARTCIMAWLWGGHPPGFGNGDKWGWFGNGKISWRFLRFEFYYLRIRTELVYDFVLSNGQRVLFRLVDVAIVLIEVEDVRGEKKRFPADVQDGFFYVLMHQFAPIYRSDSRNCPKQGIRHCDVEALRLLQIEDWQDELDNPPLSRILAIPQVKSVLRVVVPYKLPDTQTILAAGPSLALPRREAVNLRPYLGCPLLWILPHCPKPLIPPLKQKFSQCCLTPQTPRSGEKSLAAHPGEVLNQFFQFYFTLQDCWRHILQRDRNHFHFVSFSRLRHSGYIP